MPEDKSERTPIIEPIMLLLKSRRFITAVAGILISLVIFAIPELETMRAEITTIVVTLASVFIVGQSVEDAAAAARANPPEVSIQGNAEIVIDETLSALFNRIDENPEGTTAQLLRAKLNEPRQG